MEFILPEIEDYSLQHSSEETALLKKINRETHAKVMSPRMLSGPLQGNFLCTVTSMLEARSVLEVGTYTGYSAIWMAMGMHPEGKLITIDVNEELQKMVRGYFDESGFGNRMELKIGDAAAIIPELNGPFDLVFIDADKRNYALYYDLVFDKVRPGGFIIADNVLWSGKVLDLQKNKDQDTQFIHAFNQKLRNDDRVRPFLLPLRDGLLIVQKK